MKPRDRELALQLEKALLSFDRQKRPLPGIHKAVDRIVLVEQIVESIHRVKFVSVLRSREISDRRADPNDMIFDPLKAAILLQRSGNIEEAFWMVFLFVHFGKHARAGWRYARDVYGRLGDGNRWDWQTISIDTAGFRAWLDVHKDDLKPKGVPCGFGNHRKYESLDAYSPSGTGSVVESYVRWVSPPGTHLELISKASSKAKNDPRKTFDELYNSMSQVV